MVEDGDLLEEISIPHTPEIKVRGRRGPAGPRGAEGALFRGIVEQAQGYGHQALASAIGANVSVSQPPMPSSTYSASQLLSKP